MISGWQGKLFYGKAVAQGHSRYMKAQVVFLPVTAIKIVGRKESNGKSVLYSFGC